MLILYHSGLTTCSKQVRHCLREKGLTYESRYVDLLRFEHLSPAYLAINPNGVVPTLVHDGHIVTNSACINEYIDETFPEPPLSPPDALGRARMRQWTWTADDAHHQGARITRNRVLKSAVEGMTPGEVELALKLMPVPARRERWQKMAEGGHSAAEIDTALEHVRFVAGRMEHELTESGPWLAGNTFSLGDIGMASIVHRVMELFPQMLGREAFPHVADWYQRLMARPAAKFAYAGNTDETPKVGPGRTAAGIFDYRVGPHTYSP